MLEFTINGPPIPKARARMCKSGFVFDPQSKQKKKVQSIIKLLCAFYKHAMYPPEIPVRVEIKFYFDLPRKNDTKTYNLFLWGCIDNISKPDDDNLEKFYKDCMSKIVYYDDKQIISTTLKKEYDIKPRTEIKVMAKKTLPQKAKDVLAIMKPEELIQLVDDLGMIVDYIDRVGVSESGDIHNMQLSAACLISEFADKFSPCLSKVSKKYPGIWKEFKQDIEITKSDQNERYISFKGKTIC
jgi:Holliday junction resolvase RusA-like endonuclease